MTMIENGAEPGLCEASHWPKSNLLQTDTNTITDMFTPTDEKH